MIDSNAVLTKFYMLKGQKQQLEKQLNDYNQQLLDLENDIKSLQTIRENVSKITQDVYLNVKNHIETVVTYALQSILESNSIRFEIEISESRNKTELEFYVVSKIGDEEIKTIPEEANGGGIVDILSMALRIALLELMNSPYVNGPIILDEPGKMLSVDYSSKFALFLKQIVEKLNRQVIIVTHNSEIINNLDNCFVITKQDGKSLLLNNNHYDIV